MAKTPLETLRERAEAALRAAPCERPAPSPEQFRELVHDLHTHQIELEMQNEELRRAQWQLAESRDKYVELYDFAPVGYATLSRKGLILDANLTLAGMLRVERGRLIQSRLSSFVHKEDTDVLYQHRRQLLEDEQPRTCELRMRRAAECFWVRIASTLSKEKERGEIRIQHSIMQIEDLKRAQHASAVAKESAETANRAKSAFLANMSHEIRSPMTSIMGFADLLIGSELSPDEIREFSSTIHQNAENLLKIIGDILDISKIEAEKVELEPIGFSPQKMMQEIVSTTKLRAAEKHLTLNVHYDDPFPKKIHSDPNRLRQILLNLIGNAIKFTDTGGVTIRARCIETEDSRTRVQFEIADTGIGIAPDDLQELFEPFAQARTFTSRCRGGTGLGLSISKKLAEMLGGRVDAKSALGEGSTFTLTIDPGPLENVVMLEEPVKLSLRGAAPPTKKEPPLSGRVLLADDDPGIRRLIAHIFREFGLEIDLAENGLVACEKVANSRTSGTPYDLVLMDIRMPELDGYEVTQRLRRDGWTGPIVALTAYAMEGTRERSLRAGFDDHIEKPASHRELREVASRFLASSPESWQE
jgi:PAS domain S-box-containing protein